MSLKITIKITIKTIADSFTGDYSVQTNEMKEMSDEILDIKIIPSVRNDKNRLREDFAEVFSDVKKSKRIIEKKEELVNG